MLSLDERMGWLLLGSLIGFVLGYIVRSLRDIKEELDEVDQVVKGEKPPSERDRGFMRFPIVADLSLIVVLAITVFAAFSSQHASNEVEATQDQVQRVTKCNQAYLSALLKAVDERTKAGHKAVQANVNLQRSWYDFVRYQLHIPPHPEENQRKRAAKYAEALKNFVERSAKSETKVNQNPYPTNAGLANCISKED